MQRTKAFKRFQAARKKIIWSDYALRRDAAVAAARAIRVPRPPVGEFKSVDTQVVGPVNSTGALHLINGMTRGDDIDERDGREVTVKSIQATIQLYVTDTTGLDQTQRCIVFYDKQTNGSAPAVTDVLTAATVFSPRNLENRKRFIILMDKVVALNASAEPGSSAVFKYYRRGNFPVTFNSGNAGTVADIVTGALYVLVVGARAAGDTAGAIDSHFRVRYTDH